MGERIPHIKGSALIGLVKLARTMRKEFANALPADTLALVETRIMAGSWYPTRHHQNLLLAADRVLGNGDLKSCRQMGRIAARESLTTVYKTYVTPGDVQASLHHFADFWPLFHDTGACTWEDPAPGYVRLRITDFGLPNRPLCAAHLGWLDELVELAGGRGTATDEECQAAGAEACVYGVRWSSS